ncbi:acyl-CoA dehydrogenase family protein [Kitasatospora sp. NPDC058201]|uniref:acyl-CoA dehydrogenase family protein n=1 Tax=Streptomycetaceae TaxID=2062 RepID=UPI002E7891C1|nr:acyl-CoA dehydrogenase family protein [Streptomyces sp. BE303]MED7955238.1 acyl-CoA dehydrogenase family protein [Streptomyces sp. BE303]
MTDTTTAGVLDDAAVHAGPAVDGAEVWLRRAEAVAVQLAAGAARRDREGTAPLREVRLLKESGLVTLLGPVEYGGGGQDWSTAHRVARTVAAADASVGELLAHHYVWVSIAEFIGTDEKIQHIGEVAARARWFFSGSAKPRSAPLVIQDAGGDMLFHGRLDRALGHPVSDITILEGFLEDGDTPISALAMSDHPGLTFEPGAEEFGLRALAAGTVVADHADIPWTGALGHVDKTFVPRVYNTFLTPAFQLAQANVLIGATRGALEAAAGHTRDRWSRAPLTETAAADAAQHYGALASLLWAVEAFADAVGAEADALHARRRTVTEEERGYHAVRVAALAAQAGAAADAVTAGVFGAAGAGGAEAEAGLDRFWRDTRARRVHDDDPGRGRVVGRHLLHGEVPRPTWYA